MSTHHPEGPTVVSNTNENTTFPVSPAVQINSSAKVKKGPQRKFSFREHIPANIPFVKKKTISVPRTVYANAPDRNAETHYAHNSISTTKYSIITFIPKNLFEQFRRAANFYFLVVACIQLIPGLSSTNRYSSIIPLVFVLLVTAIKEAIEDYKRYLSDKNTNGSPCRIFRQGEFQKLKWKDVIVGDILKVEAGEMFPADLFLMNSSEYQGTCYVETANLDGETNLKLHQAIPETSHINENSDITAFKGEINCEGPNNRLYNFSGALTNEGHDKRSLSAKQLLLRGCLLKNTKWIYGLVIYTGQDSKLMQNATAPPSKRTSVERVTNRMLLMIFSFMMACCVTGAIGSYVWTRIYGNESWYLDQTFNASLTGFITFFSFLISFSVMIPISLYVSLEMVKVALAYLIGQDIEMYHEASDTPAKARTSNLLEELGQVKYIFSDKTGTLTQNQMEFFKASIAGVSYGTGLTEIAITNAKRHGEILTPPPPDPLPGVDPGFSFNDPKFVNDLQTPGPQQDVIKDFFTLLAVCHTVIPEKPKADNPDEPSDEKPDEGDVKSRNIVYQAASPDDGALVFAAKNLGFYFHTRNPKDVVCEILGEEMTFKILNTLEFSSDRKRMSVIVRDPRTERILLLTKGADTIMYKLLAPGQEILMEDTQKHLDQYASDGLRTLVLAQREIPEDEYIAWAREHNIAETAIEEREEKVAASGARIEVGLNLLGATAIEDKLQDGVGSAIAALAKANICIWVLTGDKQETAINIGYACSLLTPTMRLLIINATTAEEAATQIGLAERAYEEHHGENEEFGLIIDGATLLHVLDIKQKRWKGKAGVEKPLSIKFLDLAQKCKALVCCRVSPLQKAQVVKLVKDNERCTTLAIGDGANDVSMIQQAHIGVGISGKEGMQAVMSSDYSIAQFRFLARLLLVHGRWSYKRITTLILYSFYKNMLFSFCQFPLSFYNGYSAQTQYDGWSISIFNVVFTGLPIIFYAVLEQDVPQEAVLRKPSLYEAGQVSEGFNLKRLGYFLLTAQIQALFIFFGAYWLFDIGGVITQNGESHGIYAFGALCYISVLLTVSLRLALETHYWTAAYTIILILCNVVWFVWLAILAAVKYFISDSSMLGVAFNIWNTSGFWLFLLLLPLTCTIPVVAIELIMRTHFPKKYQLVQEAHHAGASIPEDEEMTTIFNGHGSSNVNLDHPLYDSHSANKL